jgi:hypothetical protein
LWVRPPPGADPLKTQISEVKMASVLSIQELPAFLELESAIQTDRHNHEYDCPKPDEELGSNRR